ncbi:unnamed protein product, partial [Tilletia controversa]
QEAIGKRPLSVDRLRSGDIAVNLANQKEVEALLKASDKWISTAFFGHSAVPTLRRQDFSCTRSLVVHGVPFRLGDGEDLRKELGARNDATFTKSRWLTSEAARASGARQHGSVIVTVNDSTDRTRILKRGLISCQNRHLNVNDLKILQYNCHNEPEVIAALLNHPRARNVDILCLQEPYTYYATPVSHPDWTVFGRSGPIPPEAWGNFPREQARAARPRVLTYINNKRLNIANTSLVGIEHPDMISVQLRLREDRQDRDEEQATSITDLVVTNIYNPCRSADTVPPLLHHFNTIRSDHHVLVGDFNSHHPLWQTNVHSISRHAESIITATQALHLDLVTPADTPTYHYGGRRALSSTIDLCFATEELRDRVVRCAVEHELDTGSDHAPILTTLEVSPIMATASGRFNMRKCDPQRLVAETRRAWENALNTIPPFDSKESVASWAEAAQRAMITALEKSTPRARPSPSSQEWYDEGIKHLGSLCNSARRHWQKQRTEDTRNFYVYLRNMLKSTVRSSKRQQRKVALSQADGRSLWKLAKAGRAAGGVGIVSTLRDADGSPVTAPAEKEEILRRGFWGGVPNPAPTEILADDDHFTVSSATAAAAWADFTAEEVRVSLQRSAKNTAPGPDQIPWEVLIHLSRGWPDFNDVLARLYSASIRYGHHPRIWKEATVVVLRKPNKPDYSLAKAYRPISLLNTTAKLLEGMVARRILRRAEAGGLIPPNHFGGRPFRSTEDALLALTQFAKHAHRNGRHVALMTADVSGAYNGVQGDVLAADLERLDWPDWVIQWVGSFMTERSSRLRFADHIGEVFAVPDSLPQGSPLSQLLWLVYSGGLVGATDQERKSMSVGWVDDWTIAVASPSFDDLQRRLQGICDIASNWADTHKSRFDQDKTSVCIMPKNKAAPVPDIDVRLQGTAVQTATSVKMLGVTFQSDFKFNTHVNNTVRKATAAAGALLSWGNRAWGFSADNMRTLYSQGVAPIMEYACAVWLPPDGFRGGLSALNKFRKVQRSAAIRATGAFKSTSTASLDFESGLTPVHLRLYERQALSLLRLRTVPETHPLTKVVNQACSRQPRRHKGPLHMMAAAYPDVATAKVRRKLPPDTHIPQPTPITIPDDKTAALAFHDATVATTYPTQLHVYTDGSGHDGRFGAAVHFRGGDPSTRPDDIRIGLGRMSTVYRSEATAMRSALQSIPPQTRAYIWTDSRAVALALRKRAGQRGLDAGACQCGGKRGGRRRCQGSGRTGGAISGGGTSSSAYVDQAADKESVAEGMGFVSHGRFPSQHQQTPGRAGHEAVQGASATNELLAGATPYQPHRY